ncbi:MAG: flavodoxin, partial [Dethiobacteria bacterium]|nr:flavodoxin [Dethiobacteria bacterium]
EAVSEEIITNNFASDQRDKIKFFYLRGGFNYDKLPLGDKVLMTLLKWKIRIKKKQKKELTRDEKGMLAAYSKPVDFTKIELINEIVEYVNS